MSKFLYFQDGHCNGKTPINRSGDFLSDWFIKFTELLKIAKKNKVEAIIDGGDILHSPIVAYSILDKIADMVEENGIPIYSLFGNHASLYKNIEESENTSLGHLFRRSDYFRYLKDIDENCLLINPFHIKVIDYKHNIEDELRKTGIIFQGVENNNTVNDSWSWKIAIVHAFITPKPFLPQVMHVVADDITTNADLVLVAHYHNVWKKKVGNTEFVDIGCFGRRSISEHKIIPSCILLDTEKRDYEIIELKSAKRGSDIFDLSKKDEIKEYENNLDDFIASLKDMTVQSTSLRGLVEDIAKRNKIDRNVVDILINKIQEIEK